MCPWYGSFVTATRNKKDALHNGWNQQSAPDNTFYISTTTVNVFEIASPSPGERRVGCAEYSRCLSPMPSERPNSHPTLQNLLTNFYIMPNILLRPPGSRWAKFRWDWLGRYKSAHVTNRSCVNFSLLTYPSVTSVVTAIFVAIVMLNVSNDVFPQPWLPFLGV